MPKKAGSSGKKPASGARKAIPGARKPTSEAKKPISEVQHGGFLIRGADGRLFFLRDDQNTPVPVASTKLQSMVNDFTGQQGPDYVSTMVPPGIMAILEDLFGTLWGVIFCNGPRLHQ